MLYITVPKTEFFDERSQQFVSIKETKLELEHSLVSLSRWEAKWKKPFLSAEAKTQEESLDYIRCMTVNGGIDPLVYFALTPQQMKQIQDYIADPMTATTINDRRKSNSRSREIVTSELIYYWMVSYQIPFECQKWHLGRLMTLIRVCDVKNAPAQNIPKSALMQRNKSLNAARRARLGTRG
jgi:hypothetical protein